MFTLNSAMLLYVNTVFLIHKLLTNKFLTWWRAVIPSALEQLIISATSSPFFLLVSLASISIILASSVSPLAHAARNSAALSNLTLFLKTEDTSSQVNSLLSCCSCFANLKRRSMSCSTSVFDPGSRRKRSLTTLQQQPYSQSDVMGLSEGLSYRTRLAILDF